MKSIEELKLKRVIVVGEMDQLSAQKEQISRRQDELAKEKERLDTEIEVGEIKQIARRHFLAPQRTRMEMVEG